MVFAPVVLWVTGVVVNYNTRFSVVNGNFVNFHMTYGLGRLAVPRCAGGVRRQAHPQMRGIPERFNRPM
jgi:hypothetical protein